jgi:hypothetical protein
MMLQILREGPSLRPRYFIIMSEVRRSRAFPTQKKVKYDKALFQSCEATTTIEVGPSLIEVPYPIKPILKKVGTFLKL